MTDKPTQAKRTNAYSVRDFKTMAQVALPKPIFDYCASGSFDQQTKEENEIALKKWYLRPRFLRPVSQVSVTQTLFGRRMQWPVFVSPLASETLFHPSGPFGIARACAATNTIMTLSQHSTRRMEDVAEQVPDCQRWFQCYILKDRARTSRILKRAVESGYTAIVFVVDCPTFAAKDEEARNRFTPAADGHRYVNYYEEGSSREEDDAIIDYVMRYFERDLSWNDVQWVKEQVGSNIPVIVKGILTAEDAVLAVQNGADGIMVSNSGGRQLDCCLPSIDALPQVVKAVQGRVPVLFDGGVRRGTDVLKALALGASAVGIGRPVLFALAAKGIDGVVDMLHMLQMELNKAMTISGCNCLEQVNSTLVTRSPYAKL